MSTDKPVGGDHRPDQALKPVPGQSGNRPHVPRPAGTKTPEQMRAERAQYKTTSEYLTAKAAEKTTAKQAAAKDTTAGAGIPGTPGAPGSGARDRSGTAPGRTPARGGTGGQHPPGTRDSGPATRPDAPSTRRTDGLAHPDRTRQRPFPGQSENRPHVPRPAGTKTPEQMRAERAQYKTTSEYLTAKAAEKTTAKQPVKDAAPAKQLAAPKETPTAKPGTTTERGISSRDQGRASGNRERGNAPARDNAGSGSTEKTNAARTTPSGAREHAPAAETLVSRADSRRQADSLRHASGHGSDHRPGQPGQHESTSTTGQGSGPETGHSPGKPGPAHDASATPRPDTPAPQRPTDDRPPTEGTLGPHLSWTTLPPEARTIGDTTPTGIGRKPDGEHLMEPTDNLSRADAFRRKSYEAETIEDVNDIIHEDVEWIDKLFDRPPSSSRADVPVHHPLYEPAQTEHANTTDIVMASLVATALVAEAGRVAGHGVHNLKEKTHEMIERNRHAGD